MPWQLGSGNRTDYDLYITNAYFAPDAQYQAGETTLLQLHGIDEEGNEVREIYNVGKDWISTDGGATVQSVKGNKVIPRNTNYGKFLEHFLLLGPRVAEIFESRGDANEARVWTGIVFHMDEVEFSWGRGLDPTYKNVPSAWLGYYDSDSNTFTEGEVPIDEQGTVDEPVATNGNSARSNVSPIRPAARAASAPGSAPVRPSPASRPGGGVAVAAPPVQAPVKAPAVKAAAAPAKAPAKALTPQQRAQANIAAARQRNATPEPTPEPPTPEPPTEPTDPDSPTIDADMMTQLQALAEQSPDYETFANAAVEIPGLTDDDLLSTLVFDPESTGLYAQLRG